MNLVPAPPNDFLDFMRVYHARCRERIPQVRAIAAKWAFEDLIPGLSDFDTRFILADGMTVDDWKRMSLAVGEVHTHLCRERPDWARNLEHLPGINLTVGEITDPRLFYSEFQQWTIYAGDAGTIAEVNAALAAVRWTDRDEAHHLKKFALFAGPYRRGIDPPVNLGPWTDEYALHSRLFHYFSPPVQSVVSLLLKTNIRSKLEALRLARELLPNPETIDQVFNVLSQHYEVSELYHEPALGDLERQLERYLTWAWGALKGHVSLVVPDQSDTLETLRAKVAAIPQQPRAVFFEGAKFGRLLKGRLLFYSEEIPHFDSAWLIRNELQRIVGNFFEKPLIAFGQARFGTIRSAGEVLNDLTGDLISQAEADRFRRFVSIASKAVDAGNERVRAREVAGVFDIVLEVLERLSGELLRKDGF